MALFKKPTQLDLEIERLTEALNKYEPGSPEYLRVLDAVKELSAVREAEKAHRTIDANTVANIAGSLLSIGLVMHYEDLHVIATKAWGLIGRIRR